MARGNDIIVTANPRGVFTEGVIATAQTPKPGTIMQIDATVARVGGRHTYTAYSRDADGDRPKGAFWVLLADALQGKTCTDAYAAGDRAFLYSPVAGEEINLLYKNVAGTADDVLLGDILQVDSGTGKVQVSTGGSETEVGVALEAIVDPVADQLLWAQWSGQ